MWLTLLALAPAAEPSPSVGRKNLFFFIADDLRPQLNKAYGHEFMITPNFDAFAEEGLVFDHAYCNMAICSASRNSFLTGRNPDKTRTWNFINHFREGGISDGVPGSKWITMPQFFKAAGYTTNGHGKLYHPNKPPNNDEPSSWSQNQAYSPSSNSGCSGKGYDANQTTIRFCPGTADVGNASYSDVNVTMNALNTLKTVMAPAFKKDGTNFALFLGLHFPHQPWYTPAWAVNLYPPAGEIAAAKHMYSPIAAPDVAFTAELDGKLFLSVDQDNAVLQRPGDKPAGVTGVATADMSKATGPRDATNGYNSPNQSVPLYLQQQLRLGYYSAVTHSDALFGAVMAELDGLGLKDSTLVLVTGDHGWQLGEHTQWGKHTNWEQGVQVPLIIRAPWMPTSTGKHATSIVTLVDLYRTLASLTGAASAANAVAKDVDGDDFSVLLSAPDTDTKQAAFAQYPRCPGNRAWPHGANPAGKDWYLNNCEGVPAKNITFMGYTVRSDTWRFTEWYAWDGGACAPLWDSVHATELYDHRTQASFPLDFDATENANVAADPANAAALATHKQLLLDHFQKGLQHAGCPADLRADLRVGGPMEDSDAPDGRSW